MVFSQLALKRTREHATAAANAPVGGLLTGRVHEDPTWGRRWVLVEDAVGASQPLPEDPSAELLDAVLGSLIESQPRGRVVGWYRTHARRGVYLSEAEARLHGSRFGQPWQCALILVGNQQHPVGGVFQPTEDQIMSRSVYMPFYELVDVSSEFSTAWKRTFVGWSNYQTEASVALAGKDGVSASLPATPSQRPVAEGSRDPGPGPSLRPAVRTTSRPTTGATLQRAAETTPEAAAGPISEPVAESIPARPVEPTPGPAGPRPEGLRIPPGISPEPARPVADESDSPDAEEAWSEVQIRRSLSAVGRTLGPSGLSTPVTQAPSRPPAAEPPPAEPLPAELLPAEPPTAEPPSTEETATLRSSTSSRGAADAVSRPATGPAPARPLPPPPDPRGTGMRSSLVGGSRRRSRMPVRTIVFAAAGLVAILGGGWLIRGGLGSPGPIALDDGSAGSAAGREASSEDGPGMREAGLTLGQRPLFPRRADTDPQVGTEVSPIIEGPVGPEPPEVETDDPGLGDGTGGDSGAAEASALARPGDVDASMSERGGVDQAPADDVDSQIPVRTDPTGEPTALPALDTTLDLSLADISLDDPAVAAFEDAFSIFRQEVSRYDSLRVAFDDQLEGCNALNLSYRVVRESFDRLASRFEVARQHFAGPGLQAFRNAQRQVAVVDRHFELSECPLPVGG